MSYQVSIILLFDFNVNGKSCFNLYITLNIFAFLPYLVTCFLFHGIQFLCFTHSPSSPHPKTLVVTRGRHVLASKHLTFKMLLAVNKNIYYLLQHCFFASFAWILYDVDTMRNKNINFHALVDGGRKAKTMRVMGLLQEGKKRMTNFIIV